MLIKPFTQLYVFFVLQLLFVQYTASGLNFVLNGDMI